MDQGELEKIFQESFAEFGDAIFRFCLVKVSNRELAEDFTQEVFMRYWQSLRDGKEVTNTRSLLYTIANNLAKDWYKKKKSDSLDNKMDQGFEPYDKDTLDAESQADYQLILRKLQELDIGDGELILLRYIEGLEPKDIAQILDESANTISVRLNRAIGRLQQKLNL
jgi:RNA polymerase sigma factor (sigma-70 family)